MSAESLLACYVLLLPFLALRMHETGCGPSCRWNRIAGDDDDASNVATFRLKCHEHFTVIVNGQINDQWGNSRQLFTGLRLAAIHAVSLVAQSHA